MIKEFARVTFPAWCVLSSNRSEVRARWTGCEEKFGLVLRVDGIQELKELVDVVFGEVVTKMYAGPVVAQ